MRSPAVAGDPDREALRASTGARGSLAKEKNIKLTIEKKNFLFIIATMEHLKSIRGCLIVFRRNEMHKGMAEKLGYCPDSNCFKIDWLTLSFREELNVNPHELLKKLNQILEFNEEDWEHSLTGVMTGYNRSYRYHGENYISINYHDSLKKQGVNINITGFGTTIIELEYLVKLIAYGITSGAFFTRFDVAFDDVEQSLPIQVLDEINKRFEDESDSYYNQGFSSICSLASLKMFYQGHRKFKYRGRSLSIGSRYAQGMVRIYNKSVEQKIYDKYWYRVELQTKYELAEELAKSLFDNSFKKKFIDTLNRYFRPVDFTSKNVQVSEIATHKKWLKFLEIIEDTDLTSLNSYLRK